MKVNVYEMFLNENRVPYLAAERETKIDGRKSYCSPELIAGLINDAFMADKLPEEHVWMLSFDTQYHVNGVFEISHGSANQSLLNPNQVMQRALMVGAVSIALVHNHPSGDVAPSKEDIATTEKIRAAGELINIPLIDHIIIGEDKYTSMFEMGYIEGGNGK